MIGRSLFRRIFLFPPPSHKSQALSILEQFKGGLCSTKFLISSREIESLSEVLEGKKTAESVHLKQAILIDTTKCKPLLRTVPGNIKKEKITFEHAEFASKNENAEAASLIEALISTNKLRFK